MERFPEPEIMSNRLQALAYAQADFDSSDSSFVLELEKYLLRFSKEIDSKTVIVDLGCGPGNISERISLRWQEAKVIGIDGSEEMLKIANKRKSMNQSKNINKGVDYLLMEISTLNEAFINTKIKADIVVSNSVLHHIHSPNKFWLTIKKISKPGAITFHRDLRRPSSIREAIALKKKHLSSTSRILQEDYIASLKAAYNIEELKEQLKTLTFQYLEVKELNDRYLDVFGIL